MTNTTSTQSLPTTVEAIDFYLAKHCFANSDDAREANVSFGCFGCGSIAAVTASNEMERRAQADLIDWDCCGDTFKL
jgi:hypothetical protein